MEEQKFKVIIVEDVKLELKGTEEIFRHEIPNAEVIGTAMTESEFWPLMEAQLPDLVLLDLGLGGSTTIGVDICRNIFKRYKGVRVLIFTGEILNEKLWVDVLNAIATQPTDVAKQICLYAMMKQYRLVWDFMITVIGEKYRLRDTSFGRIDLNAFFLRLQEQDEVVASWSDTTITKLKQILARVLVENEYLDSTKATKLNPVWLNSTLENAIKDNGDDAALAAFNYFS